MAKLAISDDMNDNFIVPNNLQGKKWGVVGRANDCLSAFRRVSISILIREEDPLHWLAKNLPRE